MGTPVGVHTYVKKPVKVQAIRCSADNVSEIKEFTKSPVTVLENDILSVALPTGRLIIVPGEYLIKDGTGNFSTADPVYFQEIYQFA